VTVTTLFEAGSISKPIAATAMLQLVEDGRLDLDADVNRYLTSWKVPENRFTAQEKVTLRRLVSHNAGLTVHGFPGYKTTDSIPTVPQILDGVKPANTAAVRVDTFPGAISRYSGGGTTVMQLLLSDVTGEPFPVLAKRLVFDPSGMTSSTYEQPLPDALRGRESAAHGPTGAMIPGRWHIYPEMAAAGLWTTPTDLLRWAIEIANARAGTSTKVLGKDIATAMLTVQKSPFGLGPHVEGSGRGFRFGHGGADEGFHAQLLYFPEAGQGAAVMVNSDGGQAMLDDVVLAIAAEYDWPDYKPREIVAIDVDSTALDRFAGIYETSKPIPITVTLEREGAKLFLESRFAIRTEVVFTAPDKVIALDPGYEFNFTIDPSGKVTAINAGFFKAQKTR
jgi:CubicO group peptidase (beta-lactamase class C family)